MEEKKCRCCRYFQLHYIKLHAKLIPVDGHCGYEEYSANERKRRRNNGGCERWEPIEIQKRERREQIEGVICDIRARLAELEIILKDDLS